jgi:hypothetical protein
MTRSTLPFGAAPERKAEGLFDPKVVRDACGVGFIAHMKGEPSHQIVSDALSFWKISNTGALSAPTRSPATARAS